MKVKILFPMFALLLLWGAAAAQDYYVHTIGRVGLQEEPRMWGNQVDIASRGEVVRVIGQQGDYLKIVRNGRELWMRAWAASGPIAAGPDGQAPAPMDNCCYMGWDCGTDQKKWEDGHHAYQWGECKTDFNNCCYFPGWDCQSDDDWIRGYHALHAGSCDASLQTPISTPSETASVSIAAGRTNTVRVTFRTNLRSSYSLQSRIITTVAPGTTLSVLGSRDNWLKTDWRGAEAWLANWAPMTHIGGASGATRDLVTVDIPEGVDNCCFVNWTCTTDEDWQRGYHALMDNQCTAPGPAASTTGPIPEGADNCCNVNRQCSTEREWEYGYELFKYSLCYVPNIDGNITITGSSAFASKTRQALQLLLDKSPKWYRYTQQGLRGVMEIPMGGNSGIHVDERIYRSWPNFRSNRSGEAHIIWVAGQLVHEACHVNRHVAGVEHSGYVGEKACLIEQINALEAIDPLDRVVGGRYNRLANIDDPAHQWWLYR